jgi:RND family efflux transporter MFP subunit
MRSSLFVVVALLAGCARPAPPPAAVAAEKEAPKLATVKPEKKTVRRLVDQPAQNVEAFQHAPLYAKIAGYVKKLNVDIGDRVKAGQPLVELHVPEMDVELKQKEAALLQATAEVRLAESSLKAAEAALKSGTAMVTQAESGRARARAEQARAESQHERLGKVGNAVLNPETMNESRFSLEATKAARDEVEAKVMSAKASCEECAARRDKAMADVEVARARREVAEADRDHTKAMMAYRTITAPFAGVVTRRNVDVGHFVQPAGSGKPEPLVTVERVDKMRVWVLVPELEAMWVNRELQGAAPPEVRVHGDGLGGRLLKGTVARSSVALDPRTRSLRAEIDLDNAEGLLRAGMYVYASVQLERKDVWTLPLSAVRRSEGVVTCFVMENGKPVATRLQVGLEGGGLIEVLKKQQGDGWAEITGNEEVVANPPAGLK